MKRAALCLLCFLPPCTAGASVDFTPASQVSQPALGLGVGARGIGMAEAFTAVADDVFTLAFNPAGLDLLANPQAGLMHNEWNSTLGMRQDYLALSQRLGPGGAAAALNYFSLGGFDNRDASGAALDSSADYDLGGSLGYGLSLLDPNLHLGAALELGQENLGAASSTLLGASLGVLYQANPSVRLGASLLHVGLATGGATLPTQACLGASAALLQRSLLLSAEVAQPLAGNFSLKAGLEWTLFEKLCLRAGYRAAPGQADGDLGTGPSAGMGLNLGALRLDYAYVPFGAFGGAHRISALMDFSPELFGPRILIQASNTAAQAQVDYDQGVNAMAQKDWYVAKVALGACLKMAPDFPKAREAGTYLKEADKMIAQDKASGGDPEIRKKMQLHLALAKQWMDKGDLKKAKTEVDAVLSWDPTVAEANKLSRQLASALDEQTRGLKKEAAKVLAGGDLSKAVADYRTILTIDFEDKEAKAQLAVLKGRILERVKKLHAEGIDRYVAGKIRSAITVWQDALALEPSDPENLKRDIDKAQKVLDLEKRG